ELVLAIVLLCVFAWPGALLLCALHERSQAKSREDTSRILLSLLLIAGALIAGAAAILVLSLSGRSVLSVPRAGRFDVREHRQWVLPEGADRVFLGFSIYFTLLSTATATLLPRIAWRQRLTTILVLAVFGVLAAHVARIPGILLCGVAYYQYSFDWTGQL